jgi:hypothetical protein
LIGHDDPAFDSFRQQWESQSLDSYTFELTIGCFCGIASQTPALVTVLDDTVASAVRISDNVEVQADLLPAIKTIDELFDLIEDAEGGGADDIQTEYDETVGFPSSISIDYIENAIDDEISYSVASVIEVMSRSNP